MSFLFCIKFCFCFFVFLQGIYILTFQKVCPPTITNMLSQITLGLIMSSSALFFLLRFAKEIFNYIIC